MNRKRFVFTLITLLALLAVLTASLSQAQEPQPATLTMVDAQPLSTTASLGTAFTYQGQLTQNGAPVNDTCTFRFTLWDAQAGGSDLGVYEPPAVTVSDGLFTVQLDFGEDAFNGEARWLEIAFNCGSGNVTLSPRQPLNPVPYALALPALRVEQNTSSPNLIGGYSSNSVASGMVGGTIGGGGTSSYPNTVTDHYGTVGGGAGNTAGSTATVAGGISNTASGSWSSIPGGYQNVAQGSTSFAAGNQAKANHAGTFVWADSTAADFASTDEDQFLVRASGGVGIGTNNPDPDHMLHVVGRGLFDVGTGSIRVSTPGGWPGIIAFSQNGHRRDITFKGDRLQILTSTDGTAPANDNGINIYESGNVGVKVLQITGGSDLAEPFQMAGAENIEPGAVVAIDTQHPGQLRLADVAYDRTVAGCVSGANGIRPGLIMQQEDTLTGDRLPVALSGRAYCWADATYGPIKPGDLLTTSDTPGHAMRVANYENAQGAVIGKAMSALEKGQGLVLVLIALQ